MNENVSSLCEASVLIYSYMAWKLLAVFRFFLIAVSECVTAFYVVILLAVNSSAMSIQSLVAANL